MTIALVDMDIVAYRSAASCEPTRAKEFLEPEDVAIQRADDLMHRILYEVGAEDHEGYLGGEDNFRNKLYPAYKGNRTSLKKPEWLNSVREFLATRWLGKIVNGMEADDKLAIQQTRYDGASIICSIDKDLLSVPGHHYNFVQQQICYVSPLQGLRTFYKQVITGDATDNVPAFDGKFRNKTPKFVQALIDPLENMTSEEEMYSYVSYIYMQQAEIYEGYADYEGAIAEMHRNASLLYILREEEIYWSPPGPVPDYTALSSAYSEAEPDDSLPSINV